MNRIGLFAPLALSLCLVSGCGSTTSGSFVELDAGDGGAASEGGAGREGDGGSGIDSGNPDDGDSGACVSSPQVGTACVGDLKSCDRVDPCCAQEIVCDPSTKQWRESGLACFQCEGFTCGTTICAGGAVCLARAGGIPGPDGGVSLSYECVTIPAACSRNWTCDCITKHVPPNCTLAPANACSANGVHVTLSCMGA